MNKNKKQKAEDILSDENFSPEILELLEKQSSANGKNGSKEIRNIYNYLKVPKYFFSSKEKEKVKNRIQQSVLHFNRRNRIQKWVSAAAIFIFGLLGSYGIYNHFEDSDIVSFAKKMENSQLNEETRLFLQSGEEVLIKEQESIIKYEQSGKNINIGAEEKIVQKLDVKKPVYNTVIVPYGKRSHITLSEGTKVWLNSGSKFVYPAVFENAKREVYIEGEAIFEVAHAKEFPFFVNSRDFVVKVTGTVFNVCAYVDDNISSTVLKKGKIELISTEKSLLHHEKLELSPGEMVTFNSEQNEFHRKLVNSQDYFSWRKGYYIFRSETLNNILKKISRYYNVDIQINTERWLNETFTGSLDMKESPEEVLSIIMKTIPINFSYENNLILIY